MPRGRTAKTLRTVSRKTFKGGEDVIVAPTGSKDALKALQYVKSITRHRGPIPNCGEARQVVTYQTVIEKQPEASKEEQEAALARWGGGGVVRKSFGKHGFCVLDKDKRAKIHQHRGNCVQDTAFKLVEFWGKGWTHLRFRAMKIELDDENAERLGRTYIRHALIYDPKKDRVIDVSNGKNMIMTWEAYQDMQLYGIVSTCDVIVPEHSLKAETVGAASLLFVKSVEYVMQKKAEFYKEMRVR